MTDRSIEQFALIMSLSITYVSELGLYGGGMDLSLVKELLDSLGNIHVLLGALACDMSRGNDLVGRQLPDM